ncbi:SOSS complex subunit C-like [Tubulanus polymorphus]|uniref:SOSS complex subunit C-like n=1 Tax=Tubulanus polymorphus TaxID=672921 RepID=UPI003DA53C42
MTFQAPNAGQGQQNKRILEELEERKKRLRLQTSQMTHGNSTQPVSSPGNMSPSPMNMMNNESHHMVISAGQHLMTPAQRTALQHAHANSVGYFITQDSSFGNLILPVLPRLDK